MSDQNFEAIYQRLLEKYNTTPRNAANLELIAAAAEVAGRRLAFSNWEASFEMIFKTLCEKLEVQDSLISNKDKFTFILLAARWANEDSPGRWKADFEEIYELMLGSFGARPTNAEKITLLKAAAENVSGHGK